MTNVAKRTLPFLLILASCRGGAATPRDASVGSKGTAGTTANNGGATGQGGTGGVGAAGTGTAGV
ncbi:MAG: hypothetical protein JWM82_4531, partial [Myxococcales bacterium]|nr:hypothetical protein [Myxococcales bacterium]